MKEYQMLNKKQFRIQKNTNIKLTSYSITVLFSFTILILFSVNNLYAQPYASGKSKFVGNVISNGYSIRSDFSRYWNQVTAENAGKWGSVEGTQGNYSWAQLDSIYSYSVKKGYAYKHHNLVWGQQYPSFVATVDSATLYQEIENWIKLTGQRYPKADFVDVVNEPLHSFTGTALNLVKALGGTGTTGWDWVIKAFQLARQYWSPTTKLLVNEYNIINDANGNANYVKLINILKSKGLIDGIGVQAHSGEVDGPAISTLKTNLHKLTATGVPVYISEFDINESDDNIQLQKYQSVFPLLYEDPGVYGITLWGYVYGQIWQTNAYMIDSRNAPRPAMQWLKTYLAAPFRPVLISSSATINESLTPRLIWHKSVDAISYHIQLSDNSTFTSTIMDTTITDTVITTKTLASSTVYFWRVSSINNIAESLFTDVLYFTTQVTVDVEGVEGIPTEYKLFQNYPNPFNPTTQIKYSVPRNSFVSLKIYNLIGQEVATIFEGVRQTGNYTALFNGNSLSSGVYFYQLKGNNFIESKKFVLLK